MVLKNILNRLSWREVIGGNLNLNIEDISSDSRLVFNNSLFIARKGDNFNSLKFIPQVKDRVNCIVASSKERRQISQISRKYPDKVFVLVDDLSDFSENLGKLFFKGIDKLNIIGVTGTNGKTTVTSLIGKVLNDLGIPSAVLGTIHYKWNHKLFNSFITTPDNLMLKSMLSKMCKDKIKYVVAEISSHALAQERVKGLGLTRAILTNLSQDHLDYHHSLKKYFEAKLRIFNYLKAGAKALINIDDKYGHAAYQKLKKNKLSFGLGEKAFYKVRAYRFEKRKLEFLIRLRGKNYLVKAGLLGVFNIYNVLAALSCCESLGLDLEKVIASISSFKQPPGRLEEAAEGIFIDYAHTPSALREAILALREAKFKKIVVAFGCGGDRDRTKRRKMGKIASSYADYSIITSDNPRSEEPHRICREIEKGLKGDYEIILDRKKAIKKAIRKRDKDTAVLIAGKGHENFQVFRDKKVEFNDKRVVKELIG